MKKKDALVIAVYSPPEYYPPTLNAIEFLADEYENISIISRNYPSFDWVYPQGVKLIATGNPIGVREAEQASLVKKIFFFLQFTFIVFKKLRRTKADSILIYDYMPILSLILVWPFIKKPKVLWYHNHDVGDQKYLRKWSLSWFAWKAEYWLFPRLTIFSLPSIERKIHFPMDKLNGKFFFLPNFPSKKVYTSLLFQNKAGSFNDSVKLLYQGSIGPLHGLEEIIPLLNKKVEGKSLHLVLKGFVSQDYLRTLEQLATKHQTLQRLTYLPPTGYKEVIHNAFSCHIGIGIHKKNDIMNNTLGTASNKIYEYAASGLPVLIYDNEHFRTSLEGRKWVFFTDTSETSLTQCVEEIVRNYIMLSGQAREDFSKELCYEKYIQTVVDYLPK